MIPSIIAHIGIGVGFLGCQSCGKKLCPCGMRRYIVTAALMLAEATASVIIIDRIFHV